MIFLFLLVLIFSIFLLSSLAVSVFHLSQFLGVLPVTDLAILLNVSTNFVRQSISLTFLTASLSGLGLACCAFYFIISQSAKNREMESFIRRVSIATKRFEPRSEFYQAREDIPLPTKLQPFEKHRRNDNILTFFDLKRML